MVVACRPEKLLLPWLRHCQSRTDPNRLNFSLLIFPRWKVAILKSSFSFNGSPVVFQIYESLPEGFCEGPANAHPVDNRGMIRPPLAIHYIQPYLHIYSTYLFYIFILHIFYIYSTYTLHILYIYIFYIYSTYILVHIHIHEKTCV